MRCLVENTMVRNYNKFDMHSMIPWFSPLSNVPPPTQFKDQDTIKSATQDESTTTIGRILGFQLLAYSMTRYTAPSGPANSTTGCSRMVYITHAVCK